METLAQEWIEEGIVIGEKKGIYGTLSAAAISYGWQMSKRKK